MFKKVVKQYNSFRKNNFGKIKEYRPSNEIQAIIYNIGCHTYNIGYHL